MNIPRFPEKALSEALERFLANVPSNHDGLVSVDELYNCLHGNEKRKIRKQSIVIFLKTKGVLSSPKDSDEEQVPVSSHDSSSASEEPKELEQVLMEKGGNSQSIKKAARGRPLASAEKKAEKNGDVRKGSRRTIKKKKVFDPSDEPPTAARPKKPKTISTITENSSADPTSKLWIEKPPPIPVTNFESNVENCKICQEDLEVLPPDTKPMDPQTCGDCHKWRAHGVCVAWEAQPWRCEDCRECSVCSRKRAPRESMVICKLCKEPFHPHCVNLPRSKITPDWFCTTCKNVFREDANPSNDSDLFESSQSKASESSGRTKSPSHEDTPLVQKKVRASTRRSNKKKDDDSGEEKLKADKPDEEEDFLQEEVPDCSEWTPEQVHSYFQMYVPSDDAQAFLDQEIDGRSLQLLQRSDVLSKFGLKLGPALKVFSQVKRLQERSADIRLVWP